MKRACPTAPELQVFDLFLQPRPSFRATLSTLPFIASDSRNQQRDTGSALCRMEAEFEKACTDGRIAGMSLAAGNKSGQANITFSMSRTTCKRLSY